MSMLEKILGPRSKHDKTLPYTYEARVPIFEGEEEYSSYFADTICGLVEYLDQHEIPPDGVKILEVYQGRETPVDPRLLCTPDRHWLFKPQLCRSFEAHYPGHIQESSCSFKDRDGAGCGPL